MREVFLRAMEKDLLIAYCSAGNVDAKIGRRRESGAIVLLRLEDDNVARAWDR